MKLAKSFVYAVNMLRHSPLRSWLTIIGIVIGVAAIVAIISFGNGLDKTVRSQLSGFGIDLITVTPGITRAQGFGGYRIQSAVQVLSNNTLSQKDLQSLKTVSGVLLVSPGVSGNAELSYLGEKIRTSVKGVDSSNWDKIIATPLYAGRYISTSDANAIVISYRMSKELFKTELQVGKTVFVNSKQFKVVGILDVEGVSSIAGNAIYMPLRPAREVLERNSQSFDSITLKASDANEIAVISKAVEQKLLLSRHLNERTKDFTVSSSQSIQQQVGDVIASFTLFLGAIAAISLIVGAVGVANTMFTSVLERTREIGILKAIGARNKDILMIFIFNSALVGFVGGAIGVLIGAAVSMIFPAFVPQVPGSRGQSFQADVTVETVVLAIAISVFIGTASGFIPALRASKLKPVEALRYE